MKLPKDTTWFDTGTAESIYEASSAIRTYQNENHTSIGNIDAIGYELGMIDETTLRKTAGKLKQTEYGKYLLSLIEK